VQANAGCYFYLATTGSLHILSLFVIHLITRWDQFGVVSTVTRLRAGRSGVRILVWVRDISLPENAQTGSEARLECVLG
jgi:hypothetical protein